MGYYIGVMTSEHKAATEAAWVSPAVGVAIAFALAMMAKSAALWVWRGFRPTPNP